MATASFPSGILITGTAGWAAVAAAGAAAWVFDAATLPPSSSSPRRARKAKAEPTTKTARPMAISMDERARAMSLSPVSLFDDCHRGFGGRDGLWERLRT